MPRKRKVRDPTFKSGLERKIWDVLPKGSEYESVKLKYVVEHTYNPDFVLSNGNLIEAKGRFLSADRAKHLHIKEQHPEVKVHFLFGNSQNTLTKSSKTTYAEWCEKHGFEWADFYRDGVPKEWLNKNK